MRRYRAAKASPPDSSGSRDGRHAPQDRRGPAREVARARGRAGGPAAAGLDADLRVGDAGEFLRSQGDDAWDFVFLDAERPAYAGYWPDLLRTLRAGALLAIDNVVSHAEQVTEVTGLIEREPRVTTCLVPIGAGVRLVVKRRP